MLLLSTRPQERDDAVSDTAVVYILHVDNTFLLGQELREFPEGSTLCLAISSDVQHGRLNLVQNKWAAVALKNCLAKLHLLSQSVEQLIDLECVVKEGCVNSEVPHGDTLKEQVSILYIVSKP